MEPLKKLTLKHALERSARLHPGRPSLSFVDGEGMTYAEFAEQVKALSALLSDRGVRPGDRVAILSHNMPNWGVAFFAITTMGAVVVPILPDFHDSAVHHILTHSEAKALFVAERMLPKIEEGEFPDLETRIRMDDLSIMPSDGVRQRIMETVWAGRKQLERLREYALQAAERIGGAPFKAPEIEEDDIASIIYTSGTTGHSKGVVLTHKNIVYDAGTTADLVDFRPEEKLVSVLPLAHTYECTLGLVIPIYYGASVYYLQKPPTPSILLPALEKIKPTFLLLVPLVIEKIYKNRIMPKLKASGLMRKVMKFKAGEKALFKMANKKLIKSFGNNLKCVCIGGAPLSPEVERFLNIGGFPYSVGYGMTETSPMVTGASPAEARYKACGYPIPGVEILIDNPHPDTGVGEILIKGPVVMKEYYKAPKVTEETFKDGWLKTGDLGILDDGYLYIKGRSKNVVLGPSGENIFPEELEAIINQNEFVLESLVYRHEGKLTARVHLNYETLEKKLLDAKHNIESEARTKVAELLESIKSEVNSMVASFAKLRQIIEHTEPFEKTPTHKIKRYLYVDPEENGLASA